MRLSRMITTARHSMEKSTSWKAEASLAMLATSRATMHTTMIPAVATIAKVGVRKRPSFPKWGETRRSRAMASGYRDADMIPALPVEAKAAMAATTMSPTPIPPGSQSKKAPAAVATGVRSARSSSGGRTETMIQTPTV